MIGSKVSHIGEKAFNFCNITELYSKVESLFTIAANTFHNNGRGCTLYVPKGYIELYKNTSGWNNFTKYQEM